MSSADSKQWVFGAKMVFYRRRCDVMTSHRRKYDVILRHVPAEYSRLSLSRLRLSRISAYLEDKIWSFFKRRKLTSDNKMLWIGGEIAPKEQFLPFSTIFSLYIFN